MTPAIPQILALRKILEMIEKEGKQKRLDLYLARSRKIKKGIESFGLSLFPEKGYESPTVSCINTTDKPTGLEIYNKMREKGYELAKGYGEVKDRTFRIGNMGYITMEDIDSMLDTLGQILKEYR